jgi:rubredoxin-NAD+ reductase
VSVAAPVVIVGTGMAGYGLARELRRLDRHRPIVMVTADAGTSYSKPLLSNAFVLGKDGSQLAGASAARMAESLDARILVQTRATRIDAAARILDTSAGPLAYAKLVLALGAAPVRLALGGSGAGAVLSVNHLDDYRVLRARLAALDGPAHVAILGAGLIGCEFADDLAAGGHRVTLVDPNPRPLAALASPAMSAALVQAWEGKPIALRLSTLATAVDAAAAGYVVSLASGEQLHADLVLSAVGLRPALALARDAGIATDRGILVDRYGRTSADHVHALGDCAEYTIDGPAGAATAVLPYVGATMTAARALAATLAGKPTPLGLKRDAVVVKTPSCRLVLPPLA